MHRIPVLVLESDNDLLTANTLYCLVSSNYLEVHIVSRGCDSTFRFLPGIKSYHSSTATVSDAIFLDFIEKIAYKTRAKVLVPTNTSGIDFVIHYKAILERFVQIIPVPNRKAYNIAADKGMLASYMLQNDIPTPLTVFDLTQDLEMALDKLTFPVLLKPKIGESGYSAVLEEPPITVYKDKDSLMSVLNSQKISDKYIIQQYVTGYVIGCNVLYKKGKLITYTIQKSLTSTRPFAPSFGIEFIDNKEVIKIVDALMSKLLWNGVANLDLIYDTQHDRIYILEINPRFWLTIIGSMVRSKVNFPLLACKLALNQPIETTQYKLGKYIPFGTFIKYKARSSMVPKVSFSWSDIDLLHFLNTLPPKLYSFYKERVKNAVLKVLQAKSKADVLAGQ